MAKRLFIGNLPYTITQQDLEQFLAQAGTVASVNIIIDRMSGRSKGFAFAEMSSDEEFEKALRLNGQEVDGRALVINEARPQEDRGPRTFDRPRGGGGGFNDRGGKRDFPRNKRW